MSTFKVSLKTIALTQRGHNGLGVDIYIDPAEDVKFVRAGTPAHITGFNIDMVITFRAPNRKYITVMPRCVHEHIPEIPAGTFIFTHGYIEDSIGSHETHEITKAK